jgi:hypothetical protein
MNYIRVLPRDLFNENIPHSEQDHATTAIRNQL